MASEEYAIERRLQALETRLQTAEDQLAIFALIASYGPAADGMDGQAIASIWTEDGTYRVESAELRGPAALAGITQDAKHLGYVEKGCGHVLSLPRITLDGDTAIAVNMSRVYVRDGNDYRIDRLSANRWHLVRTNRGWKVSLRENRLMTGTAEERALLASAGGAIAASGIM